MEVLDVTDPVNPSLVIRYEAPTGWMGSVVKIGNYLYLSGENGLRVLDVANPAVPAEVSYTTGIGDSYQHDLRVDGDLLYVAGGWGGLQIVNIAVPTNPVVIAFRETSHISQNTKSVELAGGLIYLANGDEIVILDLDEVTAVGSTPLPTAGGVLLGQNSPNPFNPMTKLSFDLAAPAHARLSIYDVGGHLVKTVVDELRPVGRHEVMWDGQNAAGQQVPSGVYLYRLEAGGNVQTKRMMLVK